MIRLALAVLALLTPLAWSAEIFRWVDADGRTHFSDRRPPDTEAQRIVPDTGPAGDSTPDGVTRSDTMPLLGPYAAFDILTPAAGAVLSQQTDTLEIQLELEPPLLEGHRLDLMLDDRAIALEAGSMRFQIQGVGFEVHRIQARVQDALGTMVATTPSIELELRQSVPPGVLP